MRNALAIAMAISMGSLMVGCSKKVDLAPVTPNVPAAPEEVHAPGWTLSLFSKCQEGVTPDQCVGAYGYSILTDGTFQVGPGPKGELRTGKLTPDELNSIAAAFGPGLDTSTLGTLSHDTTDATETSDTVTLTWGTSEPNLVVKSEGTDLSYQTKSAAIAKAVLSAIRNLAVKYYALPFPDACTDGAVTVAALFSSMRVCEKNSDCIFVSDSFDPIDATSGVKITTDDCSLVQPLAIANGSLVQSNKNKLQDAISQVQAACGANYARPNCTNIAELQLTGAPPVCLQGVCKGPGQTLRLR